MPATNNQSLSDDQVSVIGKRYQDQLLMWGKQVASELKKMVEFIKKEADEKAKEIQLKVCVAQLFYKSDCFLTCFVTVVVVQANEEYEIEKASVVRSETAAIDAQYERKFKQASLAQQIAKSTIANKTRLKVLEAREEVVNSVFDDAQAQLKELTKDAKKYKQVLEGLIEEGAFALLEGTIRVKARKADAKTVKDTFADVAKFYEDKTGKPVAIELAKEELDDSIAGGVVITNASGRIEVNNTFEERLKILSEQSLPAIRLGIFGPTPTRKFLN